MAEVEPNPGTFLGELIANAKRLSVFDLKFGLKAFFLTNQNQAFQLFKQ